MAAVGVPVARLSRRRPVGRASRRRGAARGFPLIIKASAARRQGMQVVHAAGEVAAAVQSAQRLARTSFGDDRLLLERYFPTARHVEVQVFATPMAAWRRSTTVIARCSAAIRRSSRRRPLRALRKGAQRHGGGCDDGGARRGLRRGGTVEFLVDPEQNFYFMEMNTRLQVEHPVTELITASTWSSGS